MIINLKGFIQIKQSAYLLSFVLLIISVAGASPKKEKGLFASLNKKHQYEIDEVTFQGNGYFDYEELLSVITSRPSRPGIFRDIINMYYVESKRNSFTPLPIIKGLEESLEDFDVELRFFEQFIVESDLKSVGNFYNSRGFHDAVVGYSFYSDSLLVKNILQYNIKEGKQYKVSALNYVGLDLVDKSIKKKLDKLMQLSIDSSFNENSLMNGLRSINSTLLRNGYFTAKYDTPRIIKDSLNSTDSIVVTFNTGKRKRLGEVKFTDSTYNQNIVAKSSKLKQLEFKTGDWYNIDKIRKSRLNLLRLNAFSQVNINITDDSTQKDSPLNVEIHTEYKSQQEWGFSPFLNRTQRAKVLNLGAELDYTHKNIFEGAQELHPFARGFVRDINRAFNDGETDLEFQAGIGFRQLLLTNIGSSKVGFSFDPSISFNKINNAFDLFRFTIPFRFPIKLVKKAYLTDIIVDFTLDRQAPKDFENAIDDGNPKFKESLQLFNSLDNFHRNNGFFFNSIFASVALIAERRNHLFSPTNGNYTNISAEAAPGLFGSLSNFYKIELERTDFWSLNKNLVIATKGRIGNIFNIDGNNIDNNYIPLERQFFAGGANSIRAWGSRELRASNISEEVIGNKEEFEFLQDFVGNKSIIEGSVELRFTFPKPEYFGETLSEIIESSGITAFFDFGNAFGWFVDNENTAPNYADLAMATGLGYRYDTPIGPVRVDFAWQVYDPQINIDPFSNLRIQIGLGHAF